MAVSSTDGVSSFICERNNCLFSEYFLSRLFWKTALGFQLATFSTAFIFSFEPFGLFKGHGFLFFLVCSLWMLLLP